MCLFYTYTERGTLQIWDGTPSWYKMNHSNCPTIGMRLPAIFELKYDRCGFNSSCPGYPTDGNPIIAHNLGVPCLGFVWTASTFGSGGGWGWWMAYSGDTYIATAEYYTYNESINIECVLP